MKLTNEQLKQIIKEELEKVLSERAQKDIHFIQVARTVHGKVLHHQHQMMGDIHDPTIHDISHTKNHDFCIGLRNVFCINCLFEDITQISDFNRDVTVLSMSKKIHSNEI